MKSPILELYLEPFKSAAAEGTAVELKLRLLAGTVPFLARYAHQDRLQDIEDDLVKLFGDALSADEKETAKSAQCQGYYPRPHKLDAYRLARKDQLKPRCHSE